MSIHPTGARCLRPYVLLRVRFPALWGDEGRGSQLATPSNRLEGLVGDRKGQHSIRIDRQYRVCFVWRDGDAWDVEIGLSEFDPDARWCVPGSLSESD